MKKRALNRRRYLICRAEPPQTYSEEDGMEERPEEESILEYARMLVGLIEDRQVGRDEIEELVKQKQRQHSLTRRSKLDYLVEQLNKDPPQEG